MEEKGIKDASGDYFYCDRDAFGPDGMLGLNCKFNDIYGNCTDA